MNARRSLVGVDVGGTSVKLGAADPEGRVLAERSFDARGGLDAVLDQLVRELVALAPAGLPDGLGLGLPGLVEQELGGVRESPNLPWLNGVAVRDALAGRLGIAPERVRLENDANAAALGELWCGAARGERHALVLTLGTGIGGGLILDGRIYHGDGAAGEVGHLRVAPDGPPCGCGGRGCLETLASASAARRRALEARLPRDAPGDLELLTARARAGAREERALLEAIGRDLGRGLGLVISLLDVRCFVLGGGFGAAFDTLLPGVRHGMREWTYGERVAGVRLAQARLGARAGWIGAARLTLADGGEHG